MEETSFFDNFKERDNQSAPEQTCERVEENAKDKNNDLNTNIGGPAACQMSRKDIEESLSQIFNQLEEKRKEDLKIVDEVVKEIMAQAKTSCQVLEQNVLQMHEMRRKELDKKAQKLVDILNNVKQAETELQTSKTSLHALCQEIQKSLV